MLQDLSPVSQRRTAMTTPQRPARASIVSGYFNPFHHGHLDLFEAAAARSGYLIVVVNNDRQQILKKGRVIQVEEVRARIVSALRVVDDVFVAVEDGPGIDGTFDAIRAKYPDTVLEFCNGGDRSPDLDTLPTDELAAAERNEISLHYGVGGDDKADSSTRILAELETK
jgi:glycerol-3-phosphate cytidylyltransferase/D-beta-D-heptose 7-phosphate kinase/D-beta-D-heptose 1-phosphate adenosyltransferase